MRDLACRTRLDYLAAFLGESSSSPILSYTGPDAEVDSVIEVLTILATPRVEVELEDFHDILQPRSQLGFRHYQKMCTLQSHLREAMLTF